MDRNFERALQLVLKHEGGYVDNPKDPGGATNLGVTIGTLSAWLGRPATKAEVRALTPAAVTPIYRKGYWDIVRADELPSGVDYCVFDAAVNSGPGRAAKWLQRAVLTEADGVVGSKTLEVVKAHPASVIINRMCDDRLNFLHGLSTWSTFGKGWKSRVDGVRVAALAMASTLPVESVEPVPVPKPDAPVPLPEPVEPVPPPKPTEPTSRRPKGWLIGFLVGCIVGAAGVYFGLMS